METSIQSTVNTYCHSFDVLDWWDLAEFHLLNIYLERHQPFPHKQYCMNVSKSMKLSVSFCKKSLNNLWKLYNVYFAAVYLTPSFLPSVAVQVNDFPTGSPSLATKLREAVGGSPSGEDRYTVCREVKQMGGSRIIIRCKSFTIHTVPPPSLEDPDTKSLLADS